LPAIVIHNRIRAFNPWPGGYATLSGRTVYLRKTDVVGVGDCKAAQGVSNVAPGSIEFKDNRLFVGTGDGLLEVIEIQAEGKKPMPVADFMRGLQKREGLAFC
jgi:methionyl-tRNA formyltransferase